MRNSIEKEHRINQISNLIWLFSYLSILMVNEYPIELQSLLLVQDLKKRTITPEDYSIKFNTLYHHV
jgi:hypothetical protein